jgi:RNA polymerase sigma-70 factor, ECF subfamily
MDAGLEEAMTVEKNTQRNVKTAALTPDEFMALLNPQLDGLFGVALRLSRSPGRAEELVQEATMKAFTHLDSFERGTNFQAWVYRILVNAFLTQQRQKKRAPVALVDDEQVVAPEPTDQPAPEQWPTASESVSDEVKQAVDDLPELFRVPLLLATLGGLAYAEIAEVLQVPVGTVMSRIHRARTRLRDELKDYARDTGWLGKNARFTSTHHLN